MGKNKFMGEILRPTPRIVILVEHINMCLNEKNIEVSKINCESLFFLT